MKKYVLAMILMIATLVTFVFPVSAWSWADDGEYKVASYRVPLLEEGTIEIDASLDAAYLAGPKIEAYPDEEPYRRGSDYDPVFEKADGDFFTYVAVDVKGLYIYAEIKDNTIFETLNTNADDGDKFEVYFDWCTPDIAHPRPEARYLDYVENGVVWDYKSYKSTYTLGGLQYLGWLACDYSGAIRGMGGFSPPTALGPEGTDSAVCETKLIDGGWACEWFVPWRDQEQIDMISRGEQFHCGIGFQTGDDSDIDQTCTPGKEQDVVIRFDQRKELGLQYYADYSMLADLMWADDYPEGYWEGTYSPSEPDDEPEPPESSDAVFAVISALVVSGAGVAIFSSKKKETN